MKLKWHQSAGLILMLAATVTLSACDDDTTTGDGGSALEVEDVGDLREALASTVCDASAQCTQDPFLLLLIEMAQSTGDCTGALLEIGFGEFDGLEEAVANGTVTFDADAAKTCLNAFRDQCFAEIPNEACERTFIGNLTEGESCAQAEECQPGLFCDTAVGDICQQTCKPAADTGEACDSDAQCGGEPGVEKVCGNDNTCVELVFTTDAALGEPCGDFDDFTRSVTCADGLFCQGLTTSDDGVCAEPVAQGQSCQDFDECEQGAFCVNGTCRPLSIRDSGQSCTTDEIEPGAPLELCNSLKGLACAAGTCEAAQGGAENQPCRGDGDIFLQACDEGLFCDFESGICQAPKANGEACFGDDECASDNCGFDTGVCEDAPVCQ